MADREIKVEEESDNSELEEGEIDEFLEGVPVPPQEQINRKEVINSPSPTAVEKTQRLIVFTPPPPSPRKDFNSEGDEQEAEEKSAKEAAAHQEPCHCRKIREENERMGKELSEVRSKYEILEEFLQIQFGPKYATFIKNRKNGAHTKPLIPATSDKGCPPKKKVDLESELKLSLERRLIPISKPKEKDGSDKSTIKSKSSKTDVKVKKPREISPFRESRAKSKVKTGSANNANPSRQVRIVRRLNKRTLPSTSQKRCLSKSSSQSQTESQSPKKARPADSPKIQFDPVGLDGSDTVQPEFKLCPLCPTVVRSEDLKNHLLIHKGITNSCISCNLDFPTRRKLEIHFLQKHRNRLAKHEDFDAIHSNTIEAPFKEWLAEMADLAIPIKQESFVSLEEIQEIPSDNEGWEVFVKSLHSEKGEEFLLELFEKFGEVADVRILQHRNRATNRRKGFSALVRMNDYGAAVQAIQSLNGYILDNEGVLNASFSIDTLRKLLKRPL